MPGLTMLDKIEDARLTRLTSFGSLARTDQPGPKKAIAKGKHPICCKVRFSLNGQTYGGSDQSKETL